MPIFGTPSSHAPISAAQTSPARVSSAPSLPPSEPATARHGPPDSRLRSKPDTDYGAWSSSCDTPRAYPPICAAFEVLRHSSSLVPNWRIWAIVSPATEMGPAARHDLGTTWPVT